MDRERVAAWFLEHRGITVDTLRAWGVGMDDWNVVFAYPNGEKRRPDPTAPLAPERRRFLFTAGLVPDLYCPLVTVGGRVAFLCEGETDTMRLWQELAGTHDVFGVGGVDTWAADDLVARLGRYERVYVLLDNDSDYMVQAQVDGSWRRMRKLLGGKARRLYLPSGVKDVCEFFLRGNDLETLHLLTERMSPSRFQPVDWNQPSPPPRWLLRDWIAMGDVTVLAGKGGLGKSFVTMALALACISGWPKCIGREVVEHGRVLYVDEENPEDVVYDRMKRLGLRPEHAGQLRYIWNKGVRLDRDPDKLIDEGLDFKPVAIFLDSLTRMHNAAEDSNAEMAALFNDSLKPLARETGAAVCLIHHHDKNAYGPRGAGDIVNAADAVINVFNRSSETSPDTFALQRTKSRRRGHDDEILVRIRDKGTGVVLETIDKLTDPVF